MLGLPESGPDSVDVPMLRSFEMNLNALIHAYTFLKEDRGHDLICIIPLHSFTTFKATQGDSRIILYVLVWSHFGNPTVLVSLH